MSPNLSSQNDYVNNLRDALLDNAALRDGLTDTEAQPLIDWALRQANYVGATIENDEDAEFKQTNLNRLVLHITRFTTRRLDDKDSEWVEKQLERLDEFSQNLGGNPLAETVRQQLMNHANLSNTEVLRILTDAFDQAEMPTHPIPSSEAEPPTDTALDVDKLWASHEDKDTRDTQEMAQNVQANLSEMKNKENDGVSSLLSSLSSAIDKHIHDIEDDETL